MISDAKITDSTGCSVSRIEVTTAGSRGSELEISSQPTTCDDKASSTSQPVAEREGVRSRSPITDPIAAQQIAAERVAVNSGPAGRRRSLLACRKANRNPAYAIPVNTP